MYDLMRYGTAVLALFIVVPIGAVIASRYRLFREAAFTSAVFGTCICDKLDINMLNMEWYRGTSWGVGVSFVDILILIVFLGTVTDRLARGEGLYWPASLAPMLLFLAWCAFNVAVSEPKILGVFELTKVVRGLIAFLMAAYFVRSEREVRLLLVGISAALLYQGYLSIGSRYIYHDALRVSGSIGHPNSLADYCALTVPVLISASFARMSTRMRLLLVAAASIGVGCAILSISRMGLLATILGAGVATVVGVAQKPTPMRLVALAMVAVILGLGLLKATDQLRQRYQWGLVKEEMENPEFEGRGVHWEITKLIVRDQPLLGVGLNNWSYWASQKYGRQVGTTYTPYEGPDIEPRSGWQGAPAHSIYMITVGELGIPGLLLLLTLVGRWLSLGGRMLVHRAENLMPRTGLGVAIGLFTILAAGLTEWTFRQAHVYLLAHLLAGGLSSTCSICRRVESGRHGNAPHERSGATLSGTGQPRQPRRHVSRLQTMSARTI